MDNFKIKYIDEMLDGAKEKDFLKYRTGELPTWCPGCGYFGITHSIVQACNELGLKNEEISVASGIGCAGRFPVFMDVYGFHTLHGRSVPVASGMKLAREELTVFAVAGDGDIMGIGGGHLPHIARKNIDITLFLFDNSIYGLTKGQSSSTTPFEQKTNSHPTGNPDQPLKPVSLALSYGSTFVARAFAGNVDEMTDIFKKGISHKGFSFIQILTPCLTFDKVNYTWDNLKNNVEKIHSEFDHTNHTEAMRLAENPRLYTGVFYQREDVPSYQEYLRSREEQ